MIASHVAVINDSIRQRRDPNAAMSAIEAALKHAVNALS
jgi:hypothetical protein